MLSPDPSDLSIPVCEDCYIALSEEEVETFHRTNEQVCDGCREERQSGRHDDELEDQGNEDRHTRELRLDGLHSHDLD